MVTQPYTPSSAVTFFVEVFNCKRSNSYRISLEKYYVVIQYCEDKIIHICLVRSIV